MALTESNVMSGITSPASPNAAQPGVTVLKIDGMKKSIAGGPITGFALHQLAGFPDELHAVGGSKVENNYDPYTVTADAEFVTKFRMSNAEGFNDEHKLADDGPKVDPPHSQTVTGLKPEQVSVNIKEG